LVASRPSAGDHALPYRARPFEELQRPIRKIEPEKAEGDGAENEREEDIAEGKEKSGGDACHAALPAIAGPGYAPSRPSLHQRLWLPKQRVAGLPHIRCVHWRFYQRNQWGGSHVHPARRRV